MLYDPDDNDWLGILHSFSLGDAAMWTSLPDVSIYSFAYLIGYVRVRHLFLFLFYE